MKDNFLNFLTSVTGIRRFAILNQLFFDFLADSRSSYSTTLSYKIVFLATVSEHDFEIFIKGSPCIASLN